MTVDKTTAIHAERDGKTFYFCSNHCRQKFLATPAGAKSAGHLRDTETRSVDYPPSPRLRVFSKEIYRIP